MTIQELGSLGELLAAIATLVTLAYLARQIRQSNRSHQIATLNRIAESTETWIDRVIENEAMLDVYIKALSANEALSRQERVRFDLLVMRLLRGTESAWQQVEWGLIDDDYWGGFDQTIRSIVGSEAGRGAFARARHMLSPAYAERVAQLIDADGADRPDSQRDAAPGE